MKGKSKGRSYQTYQNKLRKLKNFYRKTFKHSQEKKERDKSNNKPQKDYFCNRYPTEVSFLSKQKIKQADEKK